MGQTLCRPKREEFDMELWELEDESVPNEPYAMGNLSITVLGASGDLAKKKTYPALLDLFHNRLLPKRVCIVGYARSARSSEDFRAYLRPWLLKLECREVVDSFLARCWYCQGEYDSREDFAKLNKQLELVEEGSSRVAAAPQPGVTNRLFYFAIPPEAFLASARSIKCSAMSSTGFNRLIVEKPFGHDLASAKKLASDLQAIFSEDYIYRIDHYLGKEMVQNLMTFRFGNRFLEPLFNKQHVASVRITFKEDFGTEGRGGYFTNYGIIRDIIQNHLMQVLATVAMDLPPIVVGPQAGRYIRDAKVAVIKALKPIDPSDVVVGQYVSDGERPGYLEDDSIQDKEKAARVPTFAALVMYVNNSRWKGVPFFVKAGKAVDERKAEIRIQFKDAAGAGVVFGGEDSARNELVMRLQPTEAIYMKANVKTPGLQSSHMQTELDLTYKSRFVGTYNPDAYTRLVLEALLGNQGNFVRGDEITASWKLFDPLLKHLESAKHPRRPDPYTYGSRGPESADELFAKKGFKRMEGYSWHAPKTLVGA